MTLWFKGRYVAEILAGRKRDTIRRRGARQHPEQPAPAVPLAEANQRRRRIEPANPPPAARTAHKPPRGRGQHLNGLLRPVHPPARLLEMPLVV